MDIKAPAACHSSQVLDRPCYSSQVSNGSCYSSQINQCHSSILFRRQQENPSSRHEGTSIQRCEEKSAPVPWAAGGGGESPLAPLFICFFLPLGPALCKLGLVRSAVLPEVLIPVLGTSFDLPLFYFCGLFSSLSF